MANKKSSEKGTITLSPAQTLAALEKQLAAIENLKGRKIQEAELEEKEWVHLTESIVERGFGADSSAMTKVRSAKWAGSHAVQGDGYRDFHQEQVNFDQRVGQFGALLRSLISELKLLQPESEIRGAYRAGDAYEFYRDLSSLIVSSANRLLIVDAYIDETLFNLYLDKVPASVSVRILTNPHNIGTNVPAVAALYAKNKSLLLRSSNLVHDRLIFVDQRGWALGQSIKDAAHKKPTSIVELSEPTLTVTRDAHEKIWSAATVIV